MRIIVREENFEIKKSKAKHARDLGIPFSAYKIAYDRGYSNGREDYQMNKTRFLVLGITCILIALFFCWVLFTVNRVSRNEDRKQTKLEQKRAGIIQHDSWRPSEEN